MKKDKIGLIKFPAEKNISLSLNKDLLGAKGFGLLKITNLGINTPPGFIIPATVFRQYYPNKQLDHFIIQQIKKQIKVLENITSKKIGDKDAPLFLSVRSSPPTSMPGVLDTVLNIGMNQSIIKSNRFYLKTYAVFLETYLKSFRNTYPQIISGLEKIITVTSIRKKISALEELTKKNKIAVPDDPYEQVLKSIYSIYNSWLLINRKKSGIAIIVQSMALGNMNKLSMSGVVFTKDPITRKDCLTGEYLLESQDEVVSNRANPRKISNLSKRFPIIFSELLSVASKLENYFHYPQDIEFTIENGILYILQTRNMRFSKNSNNKIIDTQNILAYQKVGKGIPVSPGIVSGKITFQSQAIKKPGEALILIQNEPDLNCIRNVPNFSGLLLRTGGSTSHLAITARLLGIVAIMSANVKMLNSKECLIGRTRFYEKDIITLDGSTGCIYKRGAEEMVIRKKNILKRNLFKFSKSSGLKIIKKNKLSVPVYFTNANKVRFFNNYSIRTSFAEDKKGKNKKNLGFYFPSAFNVKKTDLNAVVDKIKKHFLTLYKTTPDIVIHSTHKIIFSGNLEINKKNNITLIELWGNYKKDKLIARKIGTISRLPSYSNKFARLIIPREVMDIPFSHYLLEFVFTKQKKLLFMEIGVLEK